MQVIALALFQKAAPYLALAVFALGLGCYIGYHVGADGLLAERLALSTQQEDDATAAAAANASAAAELVKADTDASEAEAALAAADRQASRQNADLTSQIASQAAQPGQDARDAPVLSHTLDALGATP